MTDQKITPPKKIPPRPNWYPDDGSWAFAYLLDQYTDSGYSLDEDAEYLDYHGFFDYLKHEEE